MKKNFIMFLLVFCVLTVVPIVVLLLEMLFHSDFDNSALGQMIDKMD